MEDVLTSIRNEKMILLAKVKKLKLRLKRIHEREEKIKREMMDVNAQIIYYDGLTKDIKKDINPPKLHSLLQDM
ncbi:MAG: hypothetical protein KAI64_03930 [Thermoplasmata archaeon]|nr:hypothetical protein [Thermoplasmata archaeon]